MRTYVITLVGLFVILMVGVLVVNIPAQSPAHPDGCPFPSPWIQPVPPPPNPDVLIQNRKKCLVVDPTARSIYPDSHVIIATKEYIKFTRDGIIVIIVGPYTCSYLEKEDVAI